MWKTYGKALLYVLAAILTAGLAAVTDGHIDRVEAVQIAIAGTGAVMVYVVPLDPTRGWEKTVVGVFIAAEGVLVTVIAKGITVSDWIAVGLAVLTALGVTYAPAASTRRTPAPIPRAAQAPPRY